MPHRTFPYIKAPCLTVPYLTAAQLRSQLGTWGTLAAAALLLCVACGRRGGRAVEKPSDHKV